MKYFSILILFFVSFYSCKNEPKKAMGDAVPVPAESTTKTEAGLEYLKKNAIAEDDHFARVEYSLTKLQQEYRKAEGKIPGLGKMTVFLDKHFTLILKNEIDGDVIEQKVSLKHLDPNNGGMTLVPDLEPGQFPGVTLHVLSGREGVEIRKNGELQSVERELTIYLPDRASIERITPALSQALNVVHNKIQ